MSRERLQPGIKPYSAEGLRPYRYNTMPKKAEAFNPFYAMLLVVGIVFAITAFAYCVMTVRGVGGSLAMADESTAEHSQLGLDLMALLDRHGLWIMLAQLALLGVATFGAIFTDDYWTRRAARQRADDNQTTKTTADTTGINS